jgi:serine/threonine protein phosphatase PrpC
VRSALLRGREHLELRAVDTISEGPAAIAISAGGARKVYPHTDPNEDAVAFALGSAGVLLAVADGHRGFEASEVLLEHLLAHPAPQWIEAGGASPGSWTRHSLAVLCDANAEILHERLDSEHGRSRTTLALALVLPKEGWLLSASIGDSHLFVVDAEGGVRDLAAPREGALYFLGDGEETPESLAAKCRVEALPLAGARAVVLASDGLSEAHVGVADPAAAVADALARARATAPALRAREAVRALLETALEAHRRNASGDNASAAVLWLEDTLPHA